MLLRPATTYALGAGSFPSVSVDVGGSFFFSADDGHDYREL